jgi:hypothetical protein
MRRKGLFVLSGSLVAIILGAGCASAPGATPSFTVTATNVTMPPNPGPCKGSCPTTWGNTVVTATSVNGYTGTLFLQCAASNPPAGVKLPLCSMPAAPAITLTATEPSTATMLLIPFGQVPPPLPTSTQHRGGADGPVALAGALLLVLGFRRRTRRWLMLTLIAAGTLAGVAGVSACGGSSRMGPYPFTITATDNATHVSTSTMFEVTVP